MEQLRAELSHLLGEDLSRMECVNENIHSSLWSLYDAQGNPMPLMAKSFTTSGLARQLAWKISMLARSGTVRMPVVYGVLTHEEHPGPDVLLMERLRGVSVEAPAALHSAGSSLKIRLWKVFSPGTGRTAGAVLARLIIPRKMYGRTGIVSASINSGIRLISTAIPA